MVAGATTSAFLRLTPLPITPVADRRTAFSPGISIPSPRSPAPPWATATAASTWYTPVDASARLAPATRVATLYDVLGLSGGTTSEEIKSAYQRLARSCHPDARQSPGAGASAEDFIRLHAAYSTLSDPDTRADYDRRMMMLRRASSFNSPKTVSVKGGRGGEALARLRRRSWESDQWW